MSDILISLKNIRFFYDSDRIVLNDLNFELTRDQCVHLDGANGSGKTTVLHLMVGSDDQLFCPTVQEDVAFGPLNLGKSRPEMQEVVARTLASLGLAGYEERITYKLSGGEKRLISLACVLAMQPQVLLLDEPTAGLDVDITQRIIKILNDLSLPMVIVSHDRDFIKALANRKVNLRNGKIS